MSAKRANQALAARPLWQRNYYEHVVRGEAELGRIREYILGNPASWADDEENPSLTPPTSPRRR